MKWPPLQVYAQVYMCARVSRSLHVCHLCWNCSPHLPIWQLVIDWLLNILFTQTHTHTRKVHYTPISGPVLIIMGDRCKVLGCSHAHTYTHKYRNAETQSALYLHSSADFRHARILFFSNYTHTHTFGQCVIHLMCLAVVDNNDQKSPWEGLVRRWAVPFTKTTHYSTHNLDEWPQCACF